MSSGSLIFIVILVIVFYFLLILPQRRQQKKKAEMMKELTEGAKVMTASGMYGRVTELGDSTLTVEVAPGVEIEMDRRAIVRVVNEESATNEEGHALGAPEHDEEADAVEEETLEAQEEDEEADVTESEKASDHGEAAGR